MVFPCLESNLGMGDALPLYEGDDADFGFLDGLCPVYTRSLSSITASKPGG